VLNYIELENFLSGKLEAKADLVMKKALKKNLRAKVISEAIYIA